MPHCDAPSATNGLSSPTRTAVVALVGNPNTGKTALFNALTGFHRQVANYAGVTVDVGRGAVRGAARPIELLDLPGTYSLAPAAPDEVILADALYGRIPGQARPAAILAIVDASNPVRNLYLVSQLLDTGLPLVIAVNMTDIAERRGIRIDTALLSQRLGVPVVPIIATQPRTVAPLLAALEQALTAPARQSRTRLPEALTNAARAIAEAPGDELPEGEALRVLVDRGGYAEQAFLARGGDAESLAQSRASLAAAGITPGPLEVRARYAWVDRVLNGVVERWVVAESTWTNRLDRVLTHRVWGGVALAALLYVLFLSIYTGAQPLMERIEDGLGLLGSAVDAVVVEGTWRSLLTDGLIGGVGGVLVFLPQIAILFLFIAILEDCGYLARAAFMVDRLMRPLGLSGRALLPLLSSFACAVPAIMGTRAIADRRERFITILIIPYLSCSARLPVYVLMIGAFVPAVSWAGGWLRLDALVMLGIYLVGIGAAIGFALILRHTAFSGPAPTFMLELPTYKLPRPSAVLLRVYFALRSFVLRAGTVILLVNLAVWALGYFPRPESTRRLVAAQAEAAGWTAERAEAELRGAYLRGSYLGQLGHALEPAIRPIGWDWRIGVGVVASFPAREVIIATLGTVVNLESADSAAPADLEDAIRAMTWADTGASLFTLPVALSIMVFFALCAQCASTLATIGRETRSWRWPLLSFTSMTVVAYCAAWGVAAGGRAIGL